jgi:hypothetical protein
LASSNLFWAYSLESLYSVSLLASSFNSLTLVSRAVISLSNFDLLIFLVANLSKLSANPPRVDFKDSTLSSNAAGNNFLASKTVRVSKLRITLYISSKVESICSLFLVNSLVSPS